MRSNIARRAVWSLITFVALIPWRAKLTRDASRAGRASGAIEPRRTLQTLIAVVAYRAGRATFTACTNSPLWAYVARRAVWSLFAIVTGRTSGAWSSVSALYSRGALWAYVARRAGNTLLAIVTEKPRRT